MYHRTPIIYRIADSFFRHRWLFLMAVLVVSVSTMIVVVKRSTKYVATSSMQIIPDSIAADLGVDHADPWNSIAQQNAGAFNESKQYVGSGQFVDLALQKAKLEKPIDPKPQDEDPRLGAVTNGLNASAQTSRLMTVQLVWEDPDEAARIVDAFVQQFREERTQDSTASTTTTIKFLNGEIDKYHKQMFDAENTLIAYKQNHAGELPEAQSNDIAQVSNLKSQLSAMDITADDAQMRQAALMQEMVKIKPTLLQQTNGVSPFENQINELKVRREALLASGKLPTHPVVADLTNQIAQMQKVQVEKKKAGASETSSIKETTIQENPQYQTLQGALTDAKITQATQQRQRQLLVQQIAVLEQRIKQAPAGQRMLVEKQRNYALYQATYARMVAQRQDLMLKNKLQTASAASAFSDPLPAYSVPVLGKSKLIAMLIASVVLGLIVGIILVVLSEWADRSLRYEADAEHLLGVPVLAMLPEAAELHYLPAPHGKGSNRNGTRALTGSQSKSAEIAPR